VRHILRALLIAVVIVIGVFWLLNYRPAHRLSETLSNPVGTSGSLTLDVRKAREQGAELGEKASTAIEESAISAKIKAKMALDDSVKARAIDVSTHGSVVTLSGTVRSAAEHERAIRLARETNGVTEVVDHLRVE